MDQGNLMSVTARKHRLGLYLKSKDKPFLRTVTQESVIPNSKQLTQKKSADSYKNNYGNRNWNFVKLVKSITQYEKTCLSVCRRSQGPIEQGDLLEIDRGDSVSFKAQKHRLGLCSTIKKSKFLQNAKQELTNTNFKQLEPKKNNDSFKDSYGNRNWNFVKVINEVLQRWKNYGNFRVLPSILWQDENLSKIRTLSWNFLAEYRNCKMK